MQVYGRCDESAIENKKRSIELKIDSAETDEMLRKLFFFASQTKPISGLHLLKASSREKPPDFNIRMELCGQLMITR